MKKFLVTLLAAVMLISAMSVSAFAAEVTTTGNASASITAKYSANADVDAYAASITWGSMSFTYTGTHQEWNANDMVWETKGEAGWTYESGANKVTIENKSSQAITAKFTFNAGDNANGVTGIQINGADVVAAGYSIAAATAGTGGNNGTATTAEYLVTLVGDYTSTNTDAATVGTLTIELS